MYNLGTGYKSNPKKKKKIEEEEEEAIFVIYLFFPVLTKESETKSND